MLWNYTFDKIHTLWRKLVNGMYGFLILALSISVLLNIILTISLVVANKKNKDSEDLIRRLRRRILIKSH